MGVLCNTESKAMLKFSGERFLPILVRALQKKNFSVYLASGAHNRDIHNYFSSHSFNEVNVVIEPHPLGTGGAIRNCADIIESDNFLVMNGDTLLFRFDPTTAITEHLANHAQTTTICTQSFSNQNRSELLIRDGMVIDKFLQPSHRPYGNACCTGAYVFNKNFVIGEFPRGVSSLESEILPRIVKDGKSFAHNITTPVIDFGTPERYLNISNTTLKGLIV